MNKEIKLEQVHVGQTYRDSWGQLWKVIGFSFYGGPQLINEEVGRGLWDGGRDLTIYGTKK